MVDFSFPYWVLMTAGALLAMAELLLGSFVVVWFGLGLFVVGILSAFGVSADAGMQLLLAVAIGSTALYALRDKCIAAGNGEPDVLATFVAGEGVLMVRESGKGKELVVKANGTLWRLANAEELPDVDDVIELDGLQVTITEFKGTSALISVAGPVEDVATVGGTVQ